MKYFKGWNPRAPLGDDALRYSLEYLNFDSVLDVGCGSGRHSSSLKKFGKKVTSVDILGSYPDAVVGNYMDIPFSPHDLVWCSHVLEHQLNVNNFLRKCRRETHVGGHIVVVVPPFKHQIVGGHVTVWNAGLVMYNLILAGYTCRDVKVKQCGYNIMVIARAEEFDLPPLKYDSGDIETLSPWFPPELGTQNFNGDIIDWGL